MTGGHLDERVSDLADGEVEHDDRDLALAHVARCAACRSELEATRRLKEVLAAAPTPEPSAALTRRLLALAEPGEPLPPPRPRMPGAPRPPVAAPPRARSRRPVSSGPASPSAPRRPGGRAPARRVRVLAAASFSVVAVTMGAAFAVGGEQSGAPVVVPAVDRFAVEHAAVTGSVSLPDPAYNVVSATSDGRFPVASVASVASGTSVGRVAPLATATSAPAPLASTSLTGP